MFLNEAWEHFKLAKEGAVTDETLKWYRKQLSNMMSFLGNLAIEDITVTDIRRWKKNLMERDNRWADHPTRPEVEGGLSNWSIRGYLRASRVFFNFLVKEGHLGRNPAAPAKLPPRPRNFPKYIKQKDALTILEAAMDNPRDHAIVRFFIETACRVGGITRLTLDRLDLEGEVAPNGVRVYLAVVEEKGFGGVTRERTVYFGEELAKVLRAYLRVRPSTDSDRVFIGRQGALKESGFYQILKRLAEKAGVEGNWNPHAFRHGWAYGARKKGVDIKDISDSLGHSNTRVTSDYYGRIPNIELGERHIRFSWINSVEEDSEEDESNEEDSTEEDSAKE